MKQTIQLGQNKVISEAVSTASVTYWLEVCPLGSGITLTCSFNRAGFRHHAELPRTYKTPLGARQAAASLAGESLEWNFPGANDAQTN